MVNVVLYGLQGEISVAGSSYNGVMPSFAQLADEEIAAVLNHELSSWGNDAQIENFESITPDEVTAERAQDRSAADVYQLRPALQ